MSHKEVKLFSKKKFMSCEGATLFSEKLFMSCEGVFYFMNENVTTGLTDLPKNGGDCRALV